MPTPPSSGKVTSPFGMRKHPITGVYRMHNGEDTIGAGNVAPVSGTVVFAGYDTSGAGFGNAVGIREDADPTVIWWVAHHASLKVDAGDHVAEGQRLGQIGETGAAKGVHAHTERRVGGTARPASGQATDPRDYYSSGSKPAGGGTSPIGTDDEEDDDMKKLNWIWNYDGSIGLIDDGGLLNPLISVGEYNCYARVGLLPALESAEFQASRQPDGTVWNGLLAVTKRVRGQAPATAVKVTQEDIAAIAAASAAATDAAVADDFAKVNKNIDDTPTTFVVKPA